MVGGSVVAVPFGNLVPLAPRPRPSPPRLRAVTRSRPLSAAPSARTPAGDAGRKTRPLSFRRARALAAVHRGDGARRAPLHHLVVGGRHHLVVGGRAGRRGEARGRSRVPLELELLVGGRGIGARGGKRGNRRRRRRRLLPLRVRRVNNGGGGLAPLCARRRRRLLLLHVRRVNSGGGGLAPRRLLAHRHLRPPAQGSRPALHPPLALARVSAVPGEEMPSHLPDRRGAARAAGQDPQHRDSVPVLRSGPVLDVSRNLPNNSNNSNNSNEQRRRRRQGQQRTCVTAQQPHQKERQQFDHGSTWMP